MDYLLDGETKDSTLLTDLEYEKIATLQKNTVSESKFKKLEILPEWIDRMKNSAL